MNDQELSARLKKAGATAVSDALDRLGIKGQAIGIVPVARTMRFAGRAFTIRMLPVGLTGGSVGDYIDDVAPGQVVVIDNDGRMDATVWGDILTWVASQRGVAGTVIDGVCRDSDRCVELGYPVFARASTMRTGKDRVTADAYNVAVQIAGVRVEPGDWLLGDADGVVCIPASRAVEVLTIAEQIEAVEDEIREAIRQGKRLDEARRDLGYHALQTRSR
ncbi:MAG TPA: RraA family protein [Phenylobacterium sp.]|uniref:RraA family protein n=1 Tax=Phenylobacterium sp. TaxID=1871053 RepID=UPI002B4735B1|nr:RraA family protein [Phenylobacterium sp.]HKR89905.1 RraA family protein [Phenylobacterium sp.]